MSEPVLRAPERLQTPPRQLTAEAPVQKPAETKTQDTIANIASANIASADILKPQTPLMQTAGPGSLPPPPVQAELAKPMEAAKPIVEPAQPAAPKNPFDSLEEEMARLLGRGLGDKQ